MGYCLWILWQSPNAGGKMLMPNGLRPEMQKWLETENGGVTQFDGRRQTKLFPMKAKKACEPATEDKTGTYEWADATFNSQKGCVNNCEYGYCKLRMAPLFKLMPAEGWDHPEYRSHEWILKHMRAKKIQQAHVIMYPSMHDFTIDNIALGLWTLKALRDETKAKLLLVSKPHPFCIQQIFNLNLPRDRVEFRFTIGCWTNAVWNKWEPLTPTIEDRKKCIDLCQNAGYKVSISMEPLLETDPKIIGEMIAYFNVHNLESIWIGAMNYVAAEIAPQLDYARIYTLFKNEPKVRWKESFRKHLGGLN
jgi:DNA repair photolyase